MANVSVHVCMSGTCRLAGGEAVLVEIEELCTSNATAGVDTVTVEASGCLGNCSRAPNALLVRHGAQRVEETMYERLHALSDSEEVALAALRCPQLVPLCADATEKLVQARAVRMRIAAVRELRWNTAAKLACAASSGDDDNMQSLFECAQILTAGAAHQLAYDVLLRVSAVLPDEPVVTQHTAAALSNLGRPQEACELLAAAILRLPRRASSGLKSFMNDGLLHARSILAVLNSGGTAAAVLIADAAVPKGYARWRLERVQPVSPWSAVYHFVREKKPAPNGGAAAIPLLWHTTLLAHVGENNEGPLGYVERDYTPISSAEEWRAGVCRLLVRVYAAGKATQWLLHEAARTGGCSVLLSRPAQTTSLSDVRPSSILLLVAGTGVVVAQQLLALRKWRGEVPLTAIYSCRADDALMLRALDAAVGSWTAPARLRVQVTPPNAAGETSFVVEDEQLGSATCDAAFTAAFPHILFSPGRVTHMLLREELGALRCAADANRNPSTGSPCVVVSGPQGFNDAQLALLLAAGVERAHVTILEA
jgi:ferredoxin-NADP reductase